VQDAEWSPNGDTLAVVRYTPDFRHWRLEYPIGKVLLDGINWISNPRISPDGKEIAFADHENTEGDDEGSVAVIEPDGQEKKLSSGWASIQGIAWSSASDEVWFTATKTGSAQNVRSVTLGGKLRTITSLPGGIGLQDIRNGTVLAVAHQTRLGIRALPPNGKEERELGWLGWAQLRDISRDGQKILFEEEGDGGGPNYTVFLRNTDGSPPVRIGEGVGGAISPDGKWVITKPPKEGSLSLVPSGAGEARQLTHDKITFQLAEFLPDGKQLLAIGIEPGYGARDYLIDLSSGDSKPITPEGTAGSSVSPDGHSVAVQGPDGKWGIWPLTHGGLRPIPGLGSKYRVTGWSPDGASVYVISAMLGERIANIYRVNVTTGKMDPWKSLGAELPPGATQASGPHFSSDERAYAYMYFQDLSVA
jgi:Tol biopolymer transport system component